MGADTGDARTAAVAGICAAALGEAPLSVRPIVGDGVVNAVFDVETSRAKLIFRIQFDDPFDGEFRKEAWCMERARGVGVPGPEVVAIGNHGPHAYAIHTKEAGVVGSRYTGDLEPVWRQIGQYAQRFHQVNALGFGPHLGGPVGGPVGDAPDTTLAGWVDWWEEFVFGSPFLVERGVLSARALDAARAIVPRTRAWSGEPRLCHGNLSLSNVLVDEAGRVVILDWGTAAGHLAPQFDLAELNAWSIDSQPQGLPAFLEGYGLSTGEYAAMGETLVVLQLWRLLSAGRWLLENDKAEPDTVEFLRNKLRSLLAALG